MEPVADENAEPAEDAGSRSGGNRRRRGRSAGRCRRAGRGRGEAIVEEEGPEPARIPTSLTATLREQGPRYLHRVSRRMRRSGGRGRTHGCDAPAGPAGPRRTGGAAATARASSATCRRRASSGRSGPTAPREQRTVPSRDRKAERRTKPAQPSISDLLKEGQEIIVQIAKEPLGQKGARITSHIALPGRFLVYMPTVDHIGVSRKIPSDEERMPAETRSADATAPAFRAATSCAPPARAAPKKNCAPT